MAYNSGDAASNYDANAAQAYGQQLLQQWHDSGGGNGQNIWQFRPGMSSAQLLDLFTPKQGESEKQFLQRLWLSPLGRESADQGGQLGKFTQNLSALQGWDNYANPAPPSQTPAAAQTSASNGSIATAQAGKSSATGDQLVALANQLTSQFDPNDPYTKQVINAAQGYASQQAQNQGIQGGLAIGNTQQATANAAAQLQLQKQGMASQALQGANSAFGTAGGTAVNAGQLAVNTGQLGINQGYLTNTQNQFGYQQYLNQQMQNQASATAPWNAIANVGKLASNIPGFGPAFGGVLGGIGAVGGANASIGAAQPYTGGGSNFGKGIS